MNTQLEDSPIPKYYQMKEILASQIRNGTFAIGDRLPTVEGLVRQFKTSRATAGRAIGLLQEEGFVSSSPGRGTIVIGLNGPEGDQQGLPYRHGEAVPDRSGHDWWKEILSDRSVLFMARTGAFTARDYLGGDVVGRIVVALESSLMGRDGVDRVIFASLTNESVITSKNIQKHMASRSDIAGLVVHWWAHTRQEQTEMERMSSSLASSLGLPVVFIPERVVAPGICSVSIDEEEVLQQIVGYLAGLGHERILLAGGRYGFLWVRRRVVGFRRAMELLSLPVSAGNVSVVEEDETFDTDSDMWVEAGYRSAMNKLPGSDFTAVVAINDQAASGVLRATEELGLSVPRDISVMGIDDHMFYRNLNLTTIRLPYECAAQAALELVARRLAGDSSISHITVTPQLIVRATTGPCKEKNGA